ncbi:MAG TPA: hypothetical protein VL094_04725 [Sphingomonadaceae bacterium]|nr:hypothetical protein [Sphingomonadaceae bacterium]
MVTPYKLTIPETVGAVQDLLGTMQLTSPDFTHEMFPGMNVDTTFTELFAGLENIRKSIGDDCHAALVAMAADMRKRFEANEVREGNIIAYDMQEKIAVASKSRRKTLN